MNPPTTTPPEPGLRQRLANRLVDYPFLSLLVLNPAFLATLAIALAGAVALGIAVPKMWVATPPGFRPEIRVSLVDKVQAWSLKRSALKLEAAGQWDQATRAFAAAIANDVGNPEPIRGFLRLVPKLSRPEAATVGQCVNQAQWLLALTSTNRSDVGLVAQCFDRLALFDLVVGVLEPHQEHLMPTEEAAYQKALFLTGRLERFATRTARFPQPAPDPELALCSAAFKAGWGAPALSAAAREDVRRAQEDPTLGTMATRLQLLLSYKQIDAEEYARSLQRLQAQAADRLGDHVRYWQLLDTAGRGAEARRLAGEYHATPRSAADVGQLAEVLVALGRHEQALKTLQGFAPMYGQEKGLAGARVWMLYGDRLIQAKAWDDLFAAAVQMRASPRNGKELAGLSYFLEGRALIGQGRPEEASAAFIRAVDSPFPVPQAGLEAAELMVRSGHAALAAKLLRNLEPALKNSPLYWHSVLEATSKERVDHIAFLRAARQAYTLDPTNQLFQINYAAALLINRESPAEASKLTLPFLQKYPDSLVAKLNHGFALAQNQRLNEAEELLKGIPRNSLNGVDATMYHLCWLQVLYARQQFTECPEHLRLIRTNYLFPIQNQWLDEVRAKVKATPPAA